MELLSEGLYGRSRVQRQETIEELELFDCALLGARNHYNCCLGFEPVALVCWSGLAHVLAEDADSETGKYIAWGMFGTGMAMIGTGRIWATSRARYDSASLMKVKNLVAFFSPISSGMVVIAVIFFI